jgi:E3 ubiquitin-protein ligase DMA1/2
MFSQPAAPSTGVLPPLTPSSTTPPSSSSRGSRLRGLINLRNYTHNHLLSRENHGSSNLHSQSTTSLPATRAGPQSSTTRQDSTHAAAAVSSSEGGRRATIAPDFLLESSQRQHPSARYSPEAAEALSRSRTEPATGLGQDSSEQQDMVRSRTATMGDVSPDMLPTIRFSAFYDPRSNRPSLSFTPLSRTLPTGKEVIRVGRYSERENHGPVPSNTPSAAPVGFKSKVVSRRHCEFWHEKGKWYIRDVKSSSGTFLNHIRLSAPGTESKPFPINDGDIVQLGIDFKGGEEMIYRCVKMRIELNRGWQAKPNSFK